MRLKAVGIAAGNVNLDRGRRGRMPTGLESDCSTRSRMICARRRMKRRRLMHRRISGVSRPRRSIRRRSQSADWQIGGTPIIGDADNIAPWPLMEAIYAGPNGDAWKKSRIQIYGWECFSWNVSTSTNTSRRPNANFPLIYDLRPNRFEQNQFVLYVERVPDEFQNDHIDWGFRVSGVYGLDYRFMISRGLFSDQLLKQNNYYGFDMPMIYVDLYLPQIFQGMNVRIGRIISEPDIEAQLAPNNLMASHSLVYGFDNYTQTGIFTTTKINDQWTLQLGISNGTDVALWQKDPGNQPTGTVMIQWISPSQTDSFYARRQRL